MRSTSYHSSKQKTIKDIMRVCTSNIASLLVGVLVGFLLPKIIGVSDYGYYKTFTLYATYVGLFHFGFSDGIYLKYGGVSFNDLNREKFRFYTSFLFFFESAIAIIMGIVAALFFQGEYKYIFVCLAIYLVFCNLTSYFQKISQITSRFKELSRRNFIKSAGIVITILSLCALHYFNVTDVTYRIYLNCYIIVIVGLALWYVYTYRDITFGPRKAQIADILYFIKIGFPLMVANLCSSLILTLDRQFVNILFNTEVYAVYAFAYNMLALVTTATSAIATVLYPKLKQLSRDKLESSYPDFVMEILIFMYFCLALYFPLNVFVSWFLPKFIGALPIFRIIFPGLAVSTVITVIMHNYYNTLGMSNKFFIKCVIAIVVSGVANYIAYYIFRTTESISIASIITLLFWYILVESYFWKLFNIKWKKNFLYMTVMMVAFYLITTIENMIISAVIYLFVFLIVTFVIYKHKIILFIQENRK